MKTISQKTKANYFVDPFQNIDRELLLVLAITHNGSYYPIKDELRKISLKEREIDSEFLKASLAFLKKNRVGFITILDKEYPPELKELYQPPFVLFYKGNVELLKRPKKIFLTGDFVDSNVVSKIHASKDALVENTVLVSRGWLPFEQLCARIYKNRGTIFVSANGVLKPSCRLPSPHINQSTLIISEYLHPVTNFKLSAKAAQRICAGISESLVLFSSNPFSGVAKLVDLFAENNKDVFCLMNPKVNEEEGLEQLVQRGVKLVSEIRA